MQSTTYRALRARSTTPLNYPLNRHYGTRREEEAGTRALFMLFMQ